jgi:uncharacterized protein YggE
MRLAKQWLLFPVAGVAAGTAALVLFGSHGQAQAPTPTPAAPQRQPALVVTGEGTAYARPDTIAVTLGIQVTGSTAAEALTAANRVMNAVIEALKAQGARDEDIQTAGLSLFPVTALPRQGETEPPRITGYRASDTVSVMFARAEQAGAAIDAAVAAGANTVSGVRFIVRDIRNLRAQAAAEAIAAAKAEAEAMAQALGVRLGQVLQVEEEVSGGPVPLTQAVARAAPADATPIQPGQVAVTARVRITYALA